MLGGLEDRPRAQWIGGPFVARQQFRGQGLELAHPLIGADRLADGEDAHGRMPLLDDVPEHVEMRIVGHARLSDAPDRRPHRRLRAIDRLTATEVELVARAATAGTPLAAELDPFRVVRALADIDHEPDRAALVLEARRHARVALALARESFVL